MHSVTRHILSSGLNSEVKILAQYSQPVVVVRFIQIIFNYLCTFVLVYRAAAVGFNRRVQYPSFLPLIKWMFHFSKHLLFLLYFKAVLDNNKDFERLYK